MITANEFYTSFVASLTRDGNYIPLETPQSSLEFTEKVKEFMVEFAKQHDLRYDAEFYKVDHTFSVDNSNSEKANAKAYGFRPHKWQIVGLIEHENDSFDWNYEVIKLAPFHCPLRVVIGYSPREKRTSGNLSDRSRLEYIVSLLKDMELANSFDSTGEFLVIIGNTGWNIAEYTGYLYKPVTSSFAPIG